MDVAVRFCEGQAFVLMECINVFCVELREGSRCFSRHTYCFADRASRWFHYTDSLDIITV
jgi:hypothetical protein